jgi:predicted site-specific integrase-resolvase
MHRWLTSYGKIKVTKLDNGYYDYDETSVFKIIKKDSRINVIYSRVSTYKQKTDLENQINKITAYCQSKNIQISKTYSDINSGLDLDRTSFNNLMDDVINLNIKNIYITHEDRLTRMSFKTIQHLFSKYGEIEVCLLNAKKTSAIVEYKKNQDALKVFKDEETLRSKYSIVLTWLGSDISKEKKENQETLNDSSPNNQNLSNPDEFTDLSFEEMEAAILKKLKRN